MNEDFIFWKIQCETCKLHLPSMIVARFGFDRHGTLHMVGICRFCLKGTHVTHTEDEIAGDIREAHNKWADEYGQEQIDLKLWEEELTEGDDDE